MQAVAVSGARQTYGDVAGHFNGMAGKYDMGCSKVNWRAPGVLFQKLGLYIPAVDTPIRLLDLGTGTGGLGRLFKGAHDDVHVTGVDISSQMLQQAMSQRNVDVAHEGSVTDLTWSPDGVFDVATCSGVLDFVADTHSFARETVRVLRPGGVFGITYEPLGTDEDGHKTLQHDPDVIRAHFENAGARILLQERMSGIYTNFVTKTAVANDIMIGVVPALEANA